MTIPVTAALGLFPEHINHSVEQPGRIQPVWRTVEYRPDLAIDLGAYTVAVAESTAR
jgi:hypothetical protein